MQANLDFRDTAPAFEVEAVKVRTAPLTHPGGCLGYRLEANGSTFVLATDSELDLGVLNKEEVQADLRAPRRYEPSLLEFFRGANLLVVDCQYTDAEYQLKRGWGHNSIAAVVDLAGQARPDVLVLCHHDPEHADEKVEEMVNDVSARLEQAGVSGMLVMAVREQLTMRVGKPRPPLALPR